MGLECWSSYDVSESVIVVRSCGLTLSTGKGYESSVLELFGLWQIAICEDHLPSLGYIAYRTVQEFISKTLLLQ
jgi:hypothetical protein